MVVVRVALRGSQCNEDCCQPRSRIIDSASRQAQVDIVLDADRKTKGRLPKLFSVQDLTCPERKKWLGLGDGY